MSDLPQPERGDDGATRYRCRAEHLHVWLTEALLCDLVHREAPAKTAEDWRDETRWRERDEEQDWRDAEYERDHD